MDIILLGFPGAGKGTQAEFLSATYQLRHLSTGALFREEVERGTALGEKVSTILQSGGLVDDATVLAVFKDYINSLEKPRAGLLLDGYPRTLFQAESLAATGLIPAPTILYLALEKEAVVARLSGRRVAQKSGRVYHIHHNPPKVAGKDDLDGEPLIQREDDRPEVIRERIAVYETKTQPLIHYYRSGGGGARFLEIQAGGSVAQVSERIKAALDSL